MIRGLHHVGVATRDLDRLVGFYVEHFRADVRRTYSWTEDEALSARLGVKESAGKLVLLGFEGAGLEIFEFRYPDLEAGTSPRSVAKPGFSHICFEVDDCQTEYERLLRAGVVFHAPPLKMPAGAVFTYGRDPDGNVVELLQPPPG